MQYFLHECGLPGDYKSTIAEVCTNTAITKVLISLNQETQQLHIDEVVTLYDANHLQEMKEKDAALDTKVYSQP